MRIIKILLVIISAIILYIGYTITKAIEFRKNQQHSFAYFEKQFSKSGFNNLIARLLIIKTGSPDYEITKNLLLKKIKPAEDYLNIYIYNQIYKKMNQEDLIANIKNYPFDINNLSEDILSMLTVNSGCRLLDIELNKSNKIYNLEDDYESSLIEKNSHEDIYIPPNNQKNLADKIAAIFKEDIDDAIKKNYEYKRNELINEISINENTTNINLIKKIQSISNKTFKNNLTNCISERHSQKEILRDNKNHCSEAYIQSNSSNECEYIESTNNGSYDYNFDLIYYILPIESETSEKVLLELIRKKGKIPATLIANYLKSNKKTEQQLAKSYIEKYFSYFNEFELIFITHLLRDHPSELEYLVKTTEKINENYTIHVFNQITKDNIESAEAIFNRRLKTKDSIVKKAMITILIKNDSLVASKYINEIFTGSSPRVIRLSPYNYLHSGLKPLEEYIKISTHDYLQTGKHFPPVYCHNPPFDEAKLWENYIERYPWFPSTDDAYYRLIYRLIVDGELQKANAFIKKYENASFSDTDVDHFIKKIKIKIQNNDYSSFKLNIKNCKTE